MLLLVAVGHVGLLQELVHVIAAEADLELIPFVVDVASQK